MTEVAGVLPDVEEVDGVVVAGFVDERVVDVGVFPCLGDLRGVSTRREKLRRNIVESYTEP